MTDTSGSHDLVVAMLHAFTSGDPDDVETMVQHAIHEFDTQTVLWALLSIAAAYVGLAAPTPFDIPAALARIRTHLPEETHP